MKTSTLTGFLILSLLPVFAYAGSGNANDGLYFILALLGLLLFVALMLHITDIIRKHPGSLREWITYSALNFRNRITRFLHSLRKRRTTDDDTYSEGWPVTTA